MKSVKHLGWLVLALALFLTGCGTNDVSSEETGSKKENNTPSPEEILEKTAEASADLKSYSSTNTQEMEIAAPDGTSQLVETYGDIVIESDPLTMHIDMTAADQDIEMYVKDNIAYINEPVSGTWMKADINSELGAQFNTEQMAQPVDLQVQQVKDLAESITVSDNDDHYTLDVKVAPEKMDEFLESEMGSAGMDMSAMGEYEYNKFNYSINIDKESSLPQSMSLDLDMSLTQEGETGQLKLVSDITFEDYNETEPIELPAEAEEAQDISDLSTAY